MKNQLVFIDNNNMLDAVPFTTSDIIAEHAGVQHHTVTRIIRNYTADFEDFGILGYQIQESKRPGQPEKLYKLNEEQSTLLITYLQNTEQVRQFKKNLVRQFYKMRKQLIDWRVVRERGKMTRRALTDSVRDNGSSKWTYLHLTNLTYKAVTGKDAAHLRVDRGASRTATVKDYLAPGELEAVEKLEGQIAVLNDLGMSYEQIKETVLNRRQTKLTAQEVSKCHSSSTRT